MILIGITGTDGAGKGEVVNFLIEKKGFAHYSGRKLLLAEIENRGLEKNRANMRNVANDLRRQFGNDYVVKEYIKRIKKDDTKKAVIESIRAVAEVNTLKKSGGVLFSVDADKKLRYERIVSRASEKDHVSFQEFVRQEALEMDDPDPHGMQKARVIEMADFHIKNNNSLKELYDQVESILKNIVSRS